MEQAEQGYPASLRLRITDVIECVLFLAPPVLPVGVVWERGARRQIKTNIKPLSLLGTRGQGRRA
eukprot:scaffold3541_cov117-Isochrysis_galbana.AAC.3